jgi:hypothetical protein
MRDDREDEAAFVAELRAAAWPGWLKWLGHKLGLRRWCPACRRMTWWHWTGYCPHAGAGAGGGTP